MNFKQLFSLIVDLKKQSLVTVTKDKYTMRNNSVLLKQDIISLKIPIIIYILISISHGYIHPYSPMDTGDTETFRISRFKKAEPVLSRKCTLKADHYKIRKLQHALKLQPGAIGFTFLVIPGDHEALRDEKGNLLANEKIADSVFRKSNIATARCELGLISFMFVQKRARNCGIGTVLSELCMVDPNIYRNTEKNHVLKFLSGISTDLAIQIRELLSSRCINGLVGLENEAESSGGFTYLSAAQRMSYQYMVVQFHNDKIENHDHSSGQCVQKFRVYKVTVALKLFDGATGRIEDGFGDNAGSGEKAMWYFCRTIAGQKWALD